MKRSNGKAGFLVWTALAIPVVWLAVIVAQCCGGGVGLFNWLAAMNAAVQAPLALHITPYTLKTVTVALAAYGFAVAWNYAERGNRRPGEEHGSAKWGNARKINACFRTKKTDRYILITRHISMSMNVRALAQEHQTNHNVLVVGGSGSGKTRYFIKPNLMQADCSYICCDPKGETYRAIGCLLENEGYDVIILNLVDMTHSDCYNPFCYLHSDTDALKLVTNLISNTTPKKSSTNDPFWDKAETALLTAFILYLMHNAPPEEQNFPTLMYMIENAAAREEDENYKSPVDLIFDDLERVEPESIALKEYRVFKQASGKTAKSILVSTAVRLAAFNLPALANITSRDDLALGTLGDRKRVIFAVIPDNDTSFNYIVGMLYSQAFQELYYAADNRYGGRLPMPVRILMDEFANVALPDDFERILSTCRSREISINIVVQNMAQLKALFKDSWENVTGNCDTLLFLGGNEQSTHEYISKFLGKETIDTRTRGITKGRSGSSNTNYQNTGRELLMPDEVRMLSNRRALLFIRGKRPVIDLKYDLKRHPNYKRISDAGKPPYERNFDPPHYEKLDLSYEVDLKNIEIIEELQDE
ncbi:MAG: type IV secretory system conjugative DNA transfer family protein [Oscillospiraceae bacterium]|nr:type IV secretory system conjugative DNA transfer family protein [Oscillospiraceae bacterium]